MAQWRKKTLISMWICRANEPHRKVRGWGNAQKLPRIALLFCSLFWKPCFWAKDIRFWLCRFNVLLVFHIWWSNILGLVLCSSTLLRLCELEAQNFIYTQVFGKSPLYILQWGGDQSVCIVKWTLCKTVKYISCYTPSPLQKPIKWPDLSFERNIMHKRFMLCIT